MDKAHVLQRSLNARREVIDFAQRTIFAELPCFRSCNVQFESEVTHGHVRWARTISCSQREPLPIRVPAHVRVHFWLEDVVFKVRSLVVARRHCCPITVALSE